MNGSPLNISVKDKDNLTNQDLDFQNINAWYKFRIIIFKDSTEINAYLQAKGKEGDRRKDFERSVQGDNKKKGELLFGSINSLKNRSIREYSDFGYIASENPDHDLVFCSSFENLDFMDHRKGKDILKDIITFPMLWQDPSKSNIISKNIIEELKSIRELIKSIITFVEVEQTRDRQLDVCGLYSESEIEELRKYEEEIEKQND